jgi:ATP-dependent DNA helicase RecG
MHELSVDARILEGFDFDDLDDASLTAYREKFAASKPGHPWLVLDTKTLLAQLGCWRKDRRTGKHGLTLGGLLMLGKHDAIITAGAAPNYFVDFRDYREREDQWSDRLCPDGTWEANLFQFCQRCWPKLVAGLEVPLLSKAAGRIDETPVHIALREAFVNALVHADYTAPGGIVIERHRERYRMENPGTLLVSEEQLRRGGVSHSRNRSLQRVFMLIGGGDQAGAGYRRIQDGWGSQRWPEPRLTVQAQPDRVRLDFAMRSLGLEQFFVAAGERRRLS